jgi:ASC-1-like (ASCH) protein
MSYQRFPDDPNNPRQDPRQPPRQPYQGYGPDQAYTPPVTPSATPAEPPPQETNSVYGRGRRAWSGYYRLRGRARQNSMSWWFFKFVQGVLLGGVLLVGGGMALVAGVVVGALQCGAAIGAGLLLAGLGVMLRYVLAPVSCRWMVTVPENAYYVVEDGDGYTLEYLDSGRRTVTWRWNARVRQYATFKAVKATATVEHVLPTDGTPITIEVRVQAAFNPARADPKAYATLRQMTKPEAFQAMLVGDVGEAVRRYLHLLHPAQQPGALRAVQIGRAHV